MTFLALFLIALFWVKSVNLAELATGFLGSAKLESSYKRLQRFMDQFELDYHRIARLVAHLMAIPQPWVLSIVEVVHRRNSDKLDDGQRSLKAKVVFSSLKIGEHRVLHHRRQIWGHWVYVSALRLVD